MILLHSALTLLESHLLLGPIESTGHAAREAMHKSLVANDFQVRAYFGGAEVSRNDTRLQDICVFLRHRSAGDFSRDEALGRAGVVFDRDRPALVLAAQLGDRDAPLAANDRPDQVNPAVPGGALKKLERATALFEGKADERRRCADEGAEWHVG